MSVEWKYIEEDCAWQYITGGAWIELAPRPRWCDRGRWIATVIGVGDIDQADGFPRYFMNLDRAKLEMAEWLDWRMTSYEDSEANRRLEVLNRFADLYAAVSHLRWHLRDDEWGALILAYNAIRERIKP